MMSAAPITPAIHGSGWRIWGQDRVTGELHRAVGADPRHSYILSGPSHSGKLATAIEFAAAMFCPNRTAEGAACHNCAICRRIQRGVFPDLSIFNLKTQGDFDKGQSKNLTLNISTVRRISSEISLRPSESNWKVVIVDDVETMQETAQEAFLKTLEEPPSYVVILLLTTDADLLSPTVLSRCVTLRMQTPSTATVQDALRASGVEKSEAHRIALLSGGVVGWAFRAANDISLLESREATRSRATEWVSSKSYERLVVATRMADEFSRDREAVFTVLQETQRVWRAVLHLLEGISEGYRDDQLTCADTMRLESVSSVSVTGCLRSVDDCIMGLEANVRPRLALQKMVLGWPVIVP